MRKGLRAAGLSAATAALALIGAVTPAAPAAAIPKDCSLSVRISADPGSMYARADLNCAKPETYWIDIIIYRHDGILGAVKVAEKEVKRTNHQGLDWLSTSEPCSDVQTNRQYSAKAYLYDARFEYPIEVKDVSSPKKQGHC